jgi:drug/metabolite transporter (DMT)-like permease
MLSSAFLVSSLLLPNIPLCTGTNPAAFTSVKPARGPLCSSRHLSHSSFRTTTPMSSRVRLRRRSELQVHDVKERSGAVDVESLTDVSTDEESLESIIAVDTKSSSNGPMLVRGVPLQSIILLNIAAIIWGTQHAVIKSVVDDISIGPDAAIKEWLRGLFGEHITALVAVNDGDAAAFFTLARFGLAALLASPYTPGLGAITQRMKGRVDAEEYGAGDTAALTNHDYSLVASNQVEKTTLSDEIIQTWRYGLELGIYMFLGYAFQAVGLETTTASRSGFLLYLNVKLVPFFSFLIFGKRIRTSTWISALVAFCGTALLAFDNSGEMNGGMSFTLNTGDLWSIAAAGASAMFILRTEAASKAVSKSSELNAASLWTVSLLSFIWTLTITSQNTLVDADVATNTQMTAAAIRRTVSATLSTFIDHPLQMFYLSAVTTTLANFLQSKGQKDISAERASIIYAMDPVYGAFVANLLLGEQLGTIGWIGSGLIFVAAATNAIFDFGPSNKDDKR